MAQNKKNTRTQIPLVAIKGAAGLDAENKYEVNSLSLEKIVEKVKKVDNEWKKYKIEVTNRSVREMIISTDLVAGNVSSIKAYDNKNVNKNKNQKDDKDIGKAE